MRNIMKKQEKSRNLQRT